MMSVNLEPELREEIKHQVQEARERIVREKFISNEDILKEFGMETMHQICFENRNI